MTSPADDSASVVVQVSVDSVDWRDVSAPVVSVDIEDHDRLTDQTTIQFDDNTGVLADASWEGFRVRAGVGWGPEPPLLFEGVVNSSRVLANPGGQRIELIALDFTSRMTQQKLDPKKWTAGQKLSTVLTDIVSRPEYKLRPAMIAPANDFTIDPARPERPANMNEWQFILDQAERQGCLAFVEFDGKGTSNFYFVPIVKVGSDPPIEKLSYCHGNGTLTEFTYQRIGAGALPVLQGSSIDPFTGSPVNVPSSDPPPRPDVPAPATGRNPTLDPSQRKAIEALTELAATAAKSVPVPQNRLSGAPAATQAALAARVALDPTRVVGLSGRGTTTGNTKLRAKSRVSISGISPWAEGDWYLKQVNHQFSRERAEFQTRSSYHTTFTATR